MSHVDLAPTRRALVAQAGALAFLGPAASAFAADRDDAELLRFGEAFEAAWADQVKIGDRLNEADDLPDDHPLWHEHDRRWNRTGAIVDKIEAIAATTLAGLIVKARACAWTHAGEPVAPDFFAPDNKPTTDQKLGASILRDLIAIDGKPVSTG